MAGVARWAAAPHSPDGIPMRTQVHLDGWARRIARWLMMLVAAAGVQARPESAPWRAGESFRREPLRIVEGGKPGFTRLHPSVTGLAFTNRIPETRHLTNQILLNGSGLAAGDVDGDGRVDVFCAGFDNESALYLNLGDWKFALAGPEAGVQLPGLDCTGAALADLDGDGDLDLVVNTLGQGTHLLFNDGRGRFQVFPRILNPGRGGMTVALADYDGDGWLDLYIANYRTRALMDMPGTRMTFRRVGDRTVVDTVNGRPATDPEFAGRFGVNEHGGIEENGEPDRLYRNLGGTNFVEVSWTGGAFLDEEGKPLREAPPDWGLAAMFHDFDGDGRPDLYVCNDFQSPDRLWLNQGGGQFRLAGALALRHTSLSSMAVDGGDLDRDGHEDFLVLEMMSRDHGQRMRWVRENFPHRPVIGRYDDRPQVEQNTLQFGRGDGTWSEAAQLAGLEAAEWAWACALVDVDLDGWEDVLVANGMERAGRDLDAADRLKAMRTGRRITEAQVFEGRKVFPRLAPENLAFRNQGDRTFREVGPEWGFAEPGVSQALVLADLDGDGDQDVLVGNLNAAVSVYRNDGSAPRVAVRLVGQSPNTRGIGARIELVPVPDPSGPSTPAPQAREVMAGGRYLSGDDPLRTFAGSLPEGGTFEVRVRWPLGGVTTVAGVSANTQLEVREPEGGGATATPKEPGATAPPGLAGWRFEDRSAWIQHRHGDQAFDDYARQPLLSYTLSQPGPGVGWVDLDGDGDDDLVVGDGVPGRVAVYRNDGGKKLVPWEAAAFRGPWSRDVTGLAVLPGAAGRSAKLLAALANYEDGAALGPGVLGLEVGAGAPEEVISASESSPGPLALADIDGDGDLDLFVGGRVLPGRWPAAASSLFLRQERGGWVPDGVRSRVLQGIGLVQGAVFSDLDGDGDADLVLACEWGPVRVLRQDREGFTDITEALGLAGCTGWWNSVAAADFDNDGRMDLVAGNWGRNTPYQRHRGRGPLRVYHGDLNGDGIHDVVEAHTDARTGREVPGLPLTVLGQALPSVRARFPTHEAFGAASIDQVLGEEGRGLQRLEAAWLETTVFLNRGDHFEPRPLPGRAQESPVFGLVAVDVDGDGNEDLFLAQNFFAVRPYVPRYDAGLGLWLRGDGRGGFEVVEAAVSGIRIEGEARGAAAADFDLDGRVDLVVGQNGAATRLFRNAEAVPGLRVRLAGPPGNPAGVGARVRWKSSGAPAREVHAGGGYLSQDSMVQVLARQGATTTLTVDWPGGGRTEQIVPAGTAEVKIEWTPAAGPR